MEINEDTRYWLDLAKQSSAIQATITKCLRGYRLRAKFPPEKKGYKLTMEWNRSLDIGTYDLTTDPPTKIGD